MIELLTGYIVGVGILHGINPSMGWLLGVYYALRNKSAKDLYLAELAVVAGHVSAISLTLGPLYYFFNANIFPSWLVGGSILGYAAYKVLRRGRHRFLGLNLSLKKLSSISFLLALQHVGTLSLIPVLCFSPTPNLQRLGLLEILTVHTLGVAAGIYTASTFTYTLGVGVLRKVWINFELLWVGVLMVTGFSTLLVPFLM